MNKYLWRTGTTANINLNHIDKLLFRNCGPTIKTSLIGVMKYKDVGQGKRKNNTDMRGKLLFTGVNLVSQQGTTGFAVLVNMNKPACC